MNAPLLTEALRYAYAALDIRPTPEEVARVVRHAVRGSPARERALRRQLALMLTHGSFGLARKAMEGPE